MMNRFTAPSHQRSWNMSRIRSGDTGPERAVRSLLHQMGFRFRLRPRHLPGSPDIVLPKFATAIFVHGCFWHRHEGCPMATTPRTNANFWAEKFLRNVERDQRVEEQLLAVGWKVLVVWQCELADKGALVERLRKSLVKSAVETKGGESTNGD
jgi:DNA mismatch endonuclease, patch repair protein